MYRLELTATDKNETLLKTIYADTWEEVKKEINDLQTYKLENIKIMLYKENGTDQLDYLGEFSSIKTKKTIIPKKKKNNLTKGIILLEILLFPFMLINAMIKEG